MNWLKKGPDLKLPSFSSLRRSKGGGEGGGSGLQAPDFLSDLYYDLRERRLLPVILLVVVAIVAVPFLLGELRRSHRARSRIRCDRGSVGRERLDPRGRRRQPRAARPEEAAQGPDGHRSLQAEIHRAAEQRTEEEGRKDRNRPRLSSTSGESSEAGPDRNRKRRRRIGHRASGRLGSGAGLLRAGLAER